MGHAGHSTGAGSPLWRGRRSVGGRGALRYNPAIQGFYQRRRRRGKSGKVALTAAARKLLAVLNAMPRDNKPWDPATAENNV